MNSDSSVKSVANWLVAGAPPPGSAENMLENLAKRLNAVEFGLDSLALYINSIHPMFPGRGYLWTSKRGVRRRFYRHEHMRDAGYLTTPMAKSINEGRIWRYQFNDDDPELKSETRTSYQSAGYTDLVILPLFNVDGTTNKCICFGTRKELGFDGLQVRQMRGLQSPLARVSEHFANKTEIQVSLSTYLGKDIGEKVLSGQIRRGEGETISAVLLFIDIVGFSAISNSRPADEVVKMLNDFYEVINTAVKSNGGEILKFIGDGALVIFPVPDDLTAQEAAAQDALNSLDIARDELRREDGKAPIKFRASLHIGDIFYGNIGSKDRFDFTAVGPAVNLASRLLDVAGDLEANIVCSKEFYELADSPDAAEQLCEVKGFEGKISAFVLERSASSL